MGSSLMIVTWRTPPVSVRGTDLGGSICNLVGSGVGNGVEAADL